MLLYRDQTSSNHIRKISSSSILNNMSTCHRKVERGIRQCNNETQIIAHWYASDVNTASCLTYDSICILRIKQWRYEREVPFKSISVFIQTTTLSPAHVSPTLGFTQTTSLVPAIFIRESNKMELSRTARVGVGLAKNLRNPKAGSIITFCAPIRTGTYNLVICSTEVENSTLYPGW